MHHKNLFLGISVVVLLGLVVTSPVWGQKCKQVTVVHGGVLPSHTWEDLATSIDMCYVRLVDKDGKIVKRNKIKKDGMCVMVNEKPGT